MTRSILLLLAIVGISACAGGKYYSNDDPKNLFVQTQVDSSVRAALHVSRVDANCQAAYQGRVALDRPTVEIGIPVEQLSFVDVSFDSSSFLSGSHKMSAGTLFKPRAGYRYELIATYRNDIYNVALREIAPSNKVREIPRRDLWNCAAAS